MTQSPITVIASTIGAPAARVALNGALEALATLSSGGTEPSTTFSGMLWHDTTTNVLKLRNDTDTAWISLFAIDQGGGLAKPSTPDVLDEDSFATNSATRPPSQQSVGAYKGVCKAWVNFNGLTTPTIQNSFNVSSITDFGTGRYYVNFIENAPYSDYATQVANSDTSAIASATGMEATRFLTTHAVSGTLTDQAEVSAVAFW